MRLLTWTAFWAFLADQLTKYLVVHVMALERNSPIEVFPPFLTFIMGRNYGINFGLFACHVAASATPIRSTSQILLFSPVQSGW